MTEEPEIKQINLNPDEMILKMRDYQISGNITDPVWYKIIKWKKTKKNPNGKPHREAIELLADIFYWYRPKESRNQKTGEVIISKKFHGDILQRSYDEIFENLGMTKEEARSALENLESLKVVKREFRTLNIKGVKVANVMFIRFYPDILKYITDFYLKNLVPLSFQTDDPPPV